APKLVHKLDPDDLTVLRRDEQKRVLSDQLSGRVPEALLDCVAHPRETSTSVERVRDQPEIVEQSLEIESSSERLQRCDPTSSRRIRRARSMVDRGRSFNSPDASYHPGRDAAAGRSAGV